MTYPANWFTAVATSPWFWVSALLTLAGLAIIRYHVRKGRVLKQEEALNTKRSLKLADKIRANDTRILLAVTGTLLVAAANLGAIMIVPDAKLNQVVEQALREKYGIVVINGKNGGWAAGGWEDNPISGRTKTVEFEKCWVTLNDTPENIQVSCPVTATNKLVDLNTLTNLKTNTLQPLKQKSD